MQVKQWKLFLDFEKEEDWLNNQAARGLAMKHYTFRRYTFEECEPGEYIYRIELLKDSVTSSDNAKYLQFVEESGVEHVDSYLNWAYFRKAAAEGPFDLYTDLESRIAHYQRIIRLFLLMVPLMLVGFFSQLILIIDFVESGFQEITARMFVFSPLIPLVVVAVLLYGRVLPRLLKKVKLMKREQDIRE
ncbi:MAG: DUF2812 domain-containing protein [Coriobacteriia bacterium]|nr:DUF2812 domain-containing protein [Coriobacteriia bacterium]